MLTTRLYDPAEYTESLEDVAAYINVVLEENDPQALAEALGTVARSRGMAAIAQRTGLSRESLYRALSSRGNPTLSTLLGVLDACGLRLQVAPLEDAHLVSA